MRHTTVADVDVDDVISATSAGLVRALATLLRGAAIRAVPVVDDDGMLLGVVSEADLMASAARPDGRRRAVVAPGTSAADPGVEGGRDHSGRAHDGLRRDRHACDAVVSAAARAMVEST